jgi:hypothetical protein
VIGLRRLVAELSESGERSGIRIVGGAALALRALPDRAARMVTRILEVGLPERPTPPPAPDIG